MKKLLLTLTLAAGTATQAQASPLHRPLFHTGPKGMAFLFGTGALVSAVIYRRRVDALSRQLEGLRTNGTPEAVGEQNRPKNNN